MNPVVVVVWSILLVCVLILAIFKDLREKFGIMLKGIGGLFVQDWARTPEGAEAVYNQCIDKTRERYNNADNLLRSYSGKLAIEKENLLELTESLKNCEFQCEALIKSKNQSNEQKAILLSMERENLLSQIKLCQDAISKFSPLVNDAQIALNQAEKDLLRLKQKKEEVVNGIIHNREIQSAYDAMDKLKRTTELDKLLAVVDDSHEDGRAQSIGARTVHESKLSTKIDNVKQDLDSQKASSYIESLKNKYTE